MGRIIFAGPEPFDLIPQRNSTTVAEGETVAMTLPVFSGGFPDNVVQIRILLNPDEAEHAAIQLRDAARAARAYGRQG
jgi:hypothetical protein